MVDNAAADRRSSKGGGMDLGHCDRRTVLKAGTLVAVAGSTAAFSAAATPIPVRVDTDMDAGPLSHIWSRCVGSDRASITLREGWRRDLDRWRSEVGIDLVRFHGIFNEDLGVYAPSRLAGQAAIPNFRLVDQVYDGLIDRGVAPLVELSFMPKALASGTRNLLFTYGGNITPPSSSEAWADFITLFLGHLLDRYGRTAVRRWPFEVWNEPNLPIFWAGSRAQYFDLYKATATAIKAVDPHIQVGGPATASMAWLPDFAGYCSANNAPIDFFSTHIYAGDNQKELFGDGTRLSQNEVIPRAIAQARRQIDSTQFAGRPLWITEWSSDSPAMIAHVVAASLPHCQMMSHWQLSAEFEELGIPGYLLKEGDMGWGMMTAGIALPTFNTYKLMRRLGEHRLGTSGPVLATRREDRTVAALVWNLAEATQPSGIPGLQHTRHVSGEAKRYRIAFTGRHFGRTALVRYVDQQRGSPMPAWRAMGSPRYPATDQVAALRASADIAPPQRRRLDADGVLIIDLPPEGVALIELV